MNYNKDSEHKNNSIIQNIISLGSSLDIELILSLEENQYESIGIKYNEISMLDDLKKIFLSSFLSALKLKKLTSLIELHSNNFLFNSVLFINKTSKKKYWSKYLIPFSPKFPKEFIFVYNIIKTILETNNIIIEESNLLDIKPNIIFTFKLTEKDKLIEKKSFLITNENNYISNKIFENKDELIEKEYKGDLFEGLNFTCKCDFFYSTIKELFNCKKYSEKEIDNFINNLIIKYPKTKICIDFDENYLIDNSFINNLLINTDIFVFEKKDILKYYNNDISIKEVSKNNNILEMFFINIKNRKIEQKMQLGIFINDLNEIFIYQKEQKSNSIKFKIKEEINLINENNKKYDEIIKKNYNSLKSVYIGAFLNRLMNQQSFENCLKMSLKCTIKYLNVLIYDLDVPTIHNYYEIKPIKKHKKKPNKLEIKNKRLESKFILDCTNVNSSKINLYNSLFDKNCYNYFNSRENRKHLIKQGFINKKGIILNVPENYYLNNNIINNIKEVKLNKENKLEKIYQLFSFFNKHHSHRNVENFLQGKNMKFFYLPKLNSRTIDKRPNNNLNNKETKEESTKDTNNKFFNSRKKNLSVIFTKTKFIS